jgi:hypothetical protein
MMGAHPNCQGPGGHVCQVPSNRLCYEPECVEPAGTLWGPHWCPEHDQDRIERIGRQMQDLQSALGELVNRGKDQEGTTAAS